MTWDTSNLKECTRYGDLWRVEKLFPHRKMWGLCRCRARKGDLFVCMPITLHKIWSEFSVPVEVGDYIYLDRRSKTTSVLKSENAKT